mmetsp:Transcript_6257/g.9472  ORF Transcript_6257/g.9472 Transcript_6257/m.9472 type:complete len:1096 (-) Transcript_6257:1154-4441(-)
MGKNKKKKSSNSNNNIANNSVNKNGHSGSWNERLLHNQAPSCPSLEAAISASTGTSSQPWLILLSLGGYMNSIEYNALLEKLEEDDDLNGSNTTMAMYSEEEIEEVLNAMDIYEIERKSFASSIVSLADALQKSTSLDTTLSKEGQTFHHNDSYYDGGSNDYARIILNIEEASSNLYTSIESYKTTSLKKQWNNVHTLMRMVMKTSMSNDSPKQNKHNITSPKKPFVTKRKSTFKSLIQEYKHQLNWDGILIAKLEDVLMNDNLYPYDQEHNHKQYIHALCHNLFSWSKALENCQLLDQTHWNEIKFLILKKEENQSVGNFDNANKTDSNTVEGRNDHVDEFINTIIRNDTNTFQDEYSPTTTADPAATTTTIDRVLSSDTIEKAVNAFLDQNIFQCETYVKTNGGNGKGGNYGSESVSRKVSDECNSGADDPTRQSNVVDLAVSNQIIGYSRCTRTGSDGHPLFLLLVGGSNSGKTYFCNSLQSKIRCLRNGQFKVICPKLPSDFLGPRVGYFEDLLLSLFTFVMDKVVMSSYSFDDSGGHKSEKYIILLDGLEHILGENYCTSRDVSNGIQKDASSSLPGASNQSHVSLRIKSIFLNIMDKFKMLDDEINAKISNNLLIICTARRSYGDIDDNDRNKSDDQKFIMKRFDKHFYLDDPGWSERYQIIRQCLGLIDSSILCDGNDDGGDGDSDMINSMLSTAVTSTMGKSRGEIALYCREAINKARLTKIGSSTTEENQLKMMTSRLKLELMQSSLQNRTPESLKQLSDDDPSSSIEMRVLSSKELLQSYLRLDDKGNIVFPLLGSNALDAWSQLRSVIITPLCQWEALNDILFGNSSDYKKNVASNYSQQKLITSGVLLTGSPGVGKTAIAYHCAAVAAKMDPTVRLLDVSCTSLISKEVGGSEKNISKLFQTARQASSPVIIILDGIENIAPVRGNDNTTEGTMDRLLSTLLTEMDGVSENNHGNRASEKKNPGIAIIGITHNPVSWIDPALRRPGRLGKCIHLDFPDIRAREDIAQRELMKIDIDFSDAGYFDPKDKNDLSRYIAMKTEGKSAAEINAISKNARMNALRAALDSNTEDRNIVVRFDHFVQAC